MDLLIVIILTLLLLPLVPAWKYNSSWSFRPLLIGGTGVLTVIILLAADIIRLG
ncbi:MAG: DUF3309 family protein [Spirochaetia bacterium]